MRKLYRMAFTTFLVIGFAGVAAAQNSTVPASSANSAGQPGLIVVQEDVLIPLIDQPEHHFRMASRYFAKGDRNQAAAQIRVGAAMVKLEAGRNNATNKTGLDAAAKGLDDVAAGVTSGSVKSPKDLNDAFARADLALARHYHEMAKESEARNEHGNTGYWLQGTADSLGDSAHWSGRELAKAGSASVNDARSLGLKLEGGAQWTAAEVKKSVSDLGSEINSLDGHASNTVTPTGGSASN